MKEELVLQRSAEKMKFFLPLTSTQALQLCHNIYINAFQTSSKRSFNELSPPKDKIYKCKIDSSIRTVTLVLKYSWNGHTIVAPKFQTFSDIVCS